MEAHGARFVQQGSTDAMERTLRIVNRELAFTGANVASSGQKGEDVTSAPVNRHRSAFYSVVKEMLTGVNREEDIYKVFLRMRLPVSAWGQFKSNVQLENMLLQATGSSVLAESTEALLKHTWFIIPDGQ